MRARRRSRWFRIQLGSGLTLALLMAGSALSPFDREAFAYALIVVGALGLTLFRPKVGAFVLGALCLNALAWMAPAVVGNLQHPGPLSAMLLPGAIAVAASSAVAGCVGTLLGRDGRWGPIVVLACAGGAMGVILLLARLGPGAALRPADIEMKTEDMAFDPAAPSAEAGDVSVRVRNADLFWHTFTVPDLGVNVTVPARGERTARFSVRPGTYEFTCAIPGHAQLGMRGTMRVR